MFGLFPTFLIPIPVNAQKGLFIWLLPEAPILKKQLPGKLCAYCLLSRQGIPGCQHVRQVDASDFFPHHFTVFPRLPPPCHLRKS